MKVQLAISICIGVVAALLPQMIFGYDILLRDGRKIEVEYYWEEDGQICYEKYNTIVKLNKNHVKVIEIDEKEVARRKKLKNERKVNMEKKYTSSGAVVFLNDGSTIDAIATWVENDLIACKTKKTMIYLKENQIQQLVKAKIPYTPKSSSKKTEDRIYKDAPAEDFMEDGTLYKFSGYTDSCPWTSSSKCRYTQWYKTENGKSYYWNPMYQKMQRGGVGNRNLTLTKPVEMEEPPENDFIENNAKYFYLGKKKLFSNNPQVKTYKSENGQLWYWNKHFRKLKTVPRSLHHRLRQPS